MKKEKQPLEIVHGFKVTDAEMKCRGMQYELGKHYTLPDAPILCGKGLHYCRVANDCFNYYSFEPTNRVFAIEAHGESVHGEDKSATNDIVFVRELAWHEVLVIVNQGKNNTGRGNTGNLNTGDWNTGDRNTGHRNTGDWNTGDWNTGDLNTGDRNTGDRNTGDWNTGDWNTGDRNTGHRNTGHRNTGDWNTGHRNTGDWNTGNRNTGDRNTGDLNTGDRNTGDLNTGNLNTGDWNTGNRNTGIFCTETPKTIELFNKPSTWSYQDWKDSEAHYLKNQVILTEWRPWGSMSDEEKEQYPRAETADGYLKKHDFKVAHQTWWAKLDERQRGLFAALPNFDAGIFHEITGIAI